MADVRTEAVPRAASFLLGGSPLSNWSHTADGMIFGVRVSRVGGNDVADPAERAAGTNPKTRCDDQPENAREDAAVVELAHSGNDETENACQDWIAHNLNPPCGNIRARTRFCSAEELAEIAETGEIGYLVGVGVRRRSAKASQFRLSA
jgi:hypothetical protein